MHSACAVRMYYVHVCARLCVPVKKILGERMHTYIVYAYIRLEKEVIVFYGPLRVIQILHIPCSLTFLFYLSFFRLFFILYQFLSAIGLVSHKYRLLSLRGVVTGSGR